MAVIKIIWVSTYFWPCNTPCCKLNSSLTRITVKYFPTCSSFKTSKQHGNDASVSTPAWHTCSLLTLTGMGLPAILALAISELVLRGTRRLAIPPSSSELERCPWPRSWSGAWAWPWPCRMQKCCLKLTLYLGNQYILYRRQRVTYTVLKPRRATHTVFVSLRHTRYIIHTHVVGKGTNAKAEAEKCFKKIICWQHTGPNNADRALFTSWNTINTTYYFLIWRKTE